MGRDHDGMHALAAGVITAAFIAVTIATTAEHWWTDLNHSRIYTIQEITTR